MLTEPLAAWAAGMPMTAAAASAHARLASFLRTPSLREGRGDGCLLNGRLGRWRGLLEDPPALRTRTENERDDGGEEQRGTDSDLPQAESVSELPLEDGADGVHDAERDHIDAEDARSQLLGRPELNDEDQPGQHADVGSPDCDEGDGISPQRGR